MYTKVMNGEQETAVRTQAKHDGITHISTGVAIVRDNKILMVYRAVGDFMGGTYELPGGGVDEGEKITDGAIREVREETGLTVSKVLGIFPGFDYSTDRKPKVRQVNFLVTVGPGDVILDPQEHDEFTWVDASNIDSLVMSAKTRHGANDALQQVKRFNLAE
jgi:8-oxo-dGTP diphosphatase